MTNRIILLLLIDNTFIVTSYQVPDTNCLRANPGVLDADLNSFNQFETQEGVTKEDIAKNVALFSTRFRRAHEITVHRKDQFELIGDGASLYTNTSNKALQLFIAEPHRNRNVAMDVRTLISAYRDVYDTIMKINSGNKSPIVGLYLVFEMDAYEEQLEAMEFVFGSKDKSKLQIGFISNNCVNLLSNKNTLKVIQRLNFIACARNPLNKPSPESSADAAIFDCEQSKEYFAYNKITAEIWCSLEYPSFGTSPHGIVGSVEGFSRFWCRIVEEVKRRKSFLQIIMLYAFDRAPHNYRENDVNLLNAMYHSGWWRRRLTTSYEESAFLEKVDELKGSREAGNCTKECSLCFIDEKCCEGLICSNDFSFQPFEIGEQQKVCSSNVAFCTPRYFLTRTADRGTAPILNVSQLSASLAIASTTVPSYITVKPRSISTNHEKPIKSLPTGTGGFVSNPFTIVCIALMSLLPVGGVVAFLIFFKRRSCSILTKQDILNFFAGSPTALEDQLERPLQNNLAVYNLPYDTSLEVSKEAFEICEEQHFGSGAIVNFVKGRMKDEEIAVKKTLPGVDKISMKALIWELKILAHLGLHENIVNLRGAHTSLLSSGKLYLFLEICPLGDLQKFLRSHREHFFGANETVGFSRVKNNRLLTSKDLARWSIQIASAMEYLAEKMVIHADIAAKNILVFTEKQVKITGFGVSCRLYEYSKCISKNQGLLPWRHMSIEALRDLSFSVQSDIWSFGVTMWEIFSLGKIPYTGYVFTGDFVELLLEGLRLPCPQLAHPLIYEVMTSCWSPETHSRSPVAIIHSRLTSAFEELHG